MEGAVEVGAERGQEAGGHHVLLQPGIARDQRGQQRHQGGGQEDRRADEGAPIGQEPAPAHVDFTATRGSAQATSSSARRLPSTTSTALTAVAAMTTG